MGNDNFQPRYYCILID
jgi:hypothetical protein